MCKGRPSVLLALSVSILLAGPPLAASAAEPLRAVGAIDVPGPPGKRFDYLEVDDEDGYLLSAHLGADRLYVIDLETDRLVKAIPDLPGIEGMAHVPDLRKVYTSNWHEDAIGVVDLQSMSVVKRLPTAK